DCHSSWQERDTTAIGTVLGPYFSARTVPAPTRTKSASDRSMANTRRSASPPRPPEVAPKVLAPSTLAIMLTRTAGRPLATGRSRYTVTGSMGSTGAGKSCLMLSADVSPRSSGWRLRLPGFSFKDTGGGAELGEVGDLSGIAARQRRDP